MAIELHAPLKVNIRYKSYRLDVEFFYVDKHGSFQGRAEFADKGAVELSRIEGFAIGRDVLKHALDLVKEEEMMEGAWAQAEQERLPAPDAA